uniref:SCAN domain-containing protein 3 n=1 Tax=Schizaphis graminum TaxID=13262 RepID=A0A2S2NPE9_SCHGA
MSLFGSTYTCEHIFSRMKIVKSKTRARLTDSHLESSLRIASSQIQPNINKLVSEKQCQLSHNKLFQVPEFLIGRQVVGIHMRNTNLKLKLKLKLKLRFK